ncbi:uncharacterized protein TRUGW13939_01590 [Talaromyces rugulosus]|uniref:Glyoxalase/fosfomycin resistance/dioxygenase domain-containing protein n=1 Tax=Talaromyces rugulosus TaxID=121627 RepID=A0A7H8QMU8_TALRU|nr:uncharacterized protein TRUGW13939_01590 [Talaromyces rugulosus]QKX54503.1 hypothetical protein TRUGW13939_01590 [Talaromyces rugulosus]
MVTSDKIILGHLAYVRYEHEDLAKSKQFAEDFSLTEVQTDEATGSDMVNCDTDTVHAKAGNAAAWGPGAPGFKAKQKPVQA